MSRLLEDKYYCKTCGCTHNNECDSEFCSKDCYDKFTEGY